MATCRDWLRTLWPASFKGIPFYVEKDMEDGSRRIVIHEFPNRDDPFLEDLGEGPRFYEVTAYVVGQSADGQAAALVAGFASIDPGTLVLNTHGPRQARCMSFSRDRSKDRHGYIAFRAKFVREGGGAAPALSASFLANTVVAAIDAVASVVGAVFSVVAEIVAVVDFVFDAVVGVIETVAAVVDTIISVATVVTDVLDLADYVVALGQDAYDVIADVRAAAIDLVKDAGDYLDRETGATPEYAERVFEMVRDLSTVMRPRDAMRAFAGAIAQFQDEPVPATAPPSVQQAASNANETRRVFRLAALGAYTEAAVRVPYTSRDEGITARADLVELYEAELGSLTGAARAPAFVALTEARNAAVAMLSATIANLAPVVTVSASLSLPGLFWAWRLYQDPNRASELTARNKVQHPSFFPTSFEALAR